MKHINLNGEWMGECVGKFSFKATVPGSTISDLINNNRLPSELLAGKMQTRLPNLKTMIGSIKRVF